ncbi:MAG: sugar phosphate isomerase/epimerase [Deltaproteobacteria bacterium]|nr:sugar phosphate isomerase/epimerase [Deltaproteobacteria bacterium]MBZ0220220.1 sugar phosphate isomerase/epimerase [Deltaproteobacteria bacterium]
MGEKKTVQVHVPYPYLLEKTDRLIEQGINPEIFMDAFFIEEAKSKDLLRIRESFAAKGLTITIHGPYIDLNPGSREEKTRLLTAGVYDRLFGVVEILKPRTVVLHAGYHERKYKGDKDLWLSQSLKTWPELVERAGRIGTVIAVENIFEREPSTLRLLMDEIPSPNFGICLDAGHMRVFSEVDIEEWFAALGPRVAEVHLHDNHGKHDEHLPIGEGSIDFERFMALLSKYAKDPVYTIEPHGENAMLRAIEAVERYL